MSVIRSQNVMEFRLNTTSVNTFRDTTDIDVRAANTLGIVSGRGNGIFDPEGFITRQEAAVMLARTGQLFSLRSEGGVDFDDSGHIAEWAVDEIGYVSGLTDSLSKRTVMGGTGNGQFSPLMSYTREQAYLTALRLLHCIQA